MGDIVNLRRSKKQRVRAEAERQAEQNRARFGRTAAQKLADRREQERQRAAVDNARLDPDAPG